MSKLLTLWPLLIVLSGAALRAHVWSRSQPLYTGRTSTYLQPARELLDRGTYSGIETLRRTPAYPLFLAAVLGVSGGNLRAVTLAQHLVGLVSVCLLMRISFLLWGSVAAAAAAGLLAAFHPAFIFYESALESEVVAVCLFLLMLLLAVQACSTDRAGARAALAAGLVGGAAALGRPELAACSLVPPAFLWSYGGGFRQALRFFAPFAALVALWMLRNWVVFGYCSLSPMGAITSLQTSGPMIDWRSPAHAEFKRVYAEILKENGGAHLAVVNLAIDRLGKDPSFRTERALLEAAALGRETALRHPFGYLWATRRNFADFARSIGVSAESEEGMGPGPAIPSTPSLLAGQYRSLLWLACAGLAAAMFLPSRAKTAMVLCCAVAVAAANCLVEIGLHRRSVEVLPVLILFAGALYGAVPRLRK